MNRRDASLALLALGAMPLRTFAQQQGKVWRIGILSSESPAGYRTRIEALRAGLRELGYVEGKNLVTEIRWAEGTLDRLPELAAELVRLNIDLLVTHATAPIRAARNATTTIPIVMAASADPIALGLVASLARPGGNVTGSAFFPRELSAKRIELLRDSFPRTTQVAVLDDPGNPTRENVIQAMEATARALQITPLRFPVRSPSEFENAFAAMAEKRVGAVAIPDLAMFLSNGKAIADLAARHRLPAAGNREFAEAGGLIGYGVNLIELWRRGAYFVDRILKGAKPADLPVEQPTKFDLVVNLKTAKALGMMIPQSLLLRADEVIQ